MKLCIPWSCTAKPSSTALSYCLMSGRPHIIILLWWEKHSVMRVFVSDFIYFGGIFAHAETSPEALKWLNLHNRKGNLV